MPTLKTRDCVGDSGKTLNIETFNTLFQIVSNYSFPTSKHSSTLCLLFLHLSNGKYIAPIFEVTALETALECVTRSLPKQCVSGQICLTRENNHRSYTFRCLSGTFLKAQLQSPWRRSPSRTPLVSRCWRTRRSAGCLW